MAVKWMLSCVWCFQRPARKGKGWRRRLQRQQALGIRRWMENPFGKTNIMFKYSNRRNIRQKRSEGNPERRLKRSWCGAESMKVQLEGIHKKNRLTVSLSCLYAVWKRKALSFYFSPCVTHFLSLPSVPVPPHAHSRTFTWQTLSFSLLAV